MFKKCLTAHGLRKTGQAILAGSRVVEEAVADHPEICRAWISHSKANPPTGKLPNDFIWYKLDATLFKELDIFGTGHPLLLIDIPKIDTWRVEDKLPKGCTLFIPFQNPENIGAVIRSAAAFSVTQVVLLEEAAHPFLPKACRAAGCALLKMKILEGPPLNELEDGKMPVYSLSMAGKDIRSFEFPESFGLIAGMEGSGLPGNLRGEDNLFIPMAPGSESLNAAASVSIALYAWSCAEDTDH